MHADRVRWNQKFEAGKEFGPPSPLVRDYYRLAPGGRALDLAAGTGRNADFLAERGFRVFAVDIADRAVSRLRKSAGPNLIPVQADFDTFPLRAETFDLIVNCRFLDRKLFPYLRESLTPGGVLLFETARESDLPGVSQPRNRDHLLRANELLHAFLSLRIVYYEEAVIQDYLFPEKTVCLAMLAAQREGGGDLGLARNPGSRRTSP
jgi:SAM-dependent methyltransferase